MQILNAFNFYCYFVVFLLNAFNFDFIVPHNQAAN